MYKKDSLDKDEMLRNVMKYQFYATDLNLYLDNFPDNVEAAEDYGKVLSKLACYVYDYEDEYGPLINFGEFGLENPSKWVNQPCPWESNK